MRTGCKYRAMPVTERVASAMRSALDALATSGQDVRALSGRVPSLNIESSFGRAFHASTSEAMATPTSA